MEQLWVLSGHLYDARCILSLLSQEYPLPDWTEPCEIAAYLGRLDPWYDNNVNTLCHMIPKLATMVGEETFLLLLLLRDSSEAFWHILQMLKGSSGAFIAEAGTCSGVESQMKMAWPPGIKGSKAPVST